MFKVAMKGQTNVVVIFWSIKNIQFDISIERKMPIFDKYRIEVRGPKYKLFCDFIDCQI